MSATAGRRWRSAADLAREEADVIDEVAEALEPEWHLLVDPDPANLLRALGDALASDLARPFSVAALTGRWAADLARASLAGAARAAGARVDGPHAGPGGPSRGAAVPAKPDPRFADPAWEENAWFYTLRQAYASSRALLEGLVRLAAPATDGGPAAQGQKAAFAAELLADALAPTNFLFTNPAALKRAFETGGRSLARGGRNFVDDLLHNGGRPRQVDTSPFRVGTSLAATPGKVVYRNELMELIQYGAQTPDVYAHPLLASPPWINKYYIMDLAPGRSFLEWAVRHGHTTFAISYRNPDASMASVTMDDYLVEGPRAALDVVADITGSETVDVVGLCLGGALSAMTAAYLAATGDGRIGTVTLLNTMLDYARPGALGCFTDEATIAGLERRMAGKGYLEASDMATTFDVLRPNELIFNYVVSNWLMGERPPPFDLLAWNADATRMPATMHSFYLRSCYLENRLARGEMELAGERLDLGEVGGDAYVVSAVNDHIVPWSSSYDGATLLGGDVRFVLSSGGHIAGIVNPPGPKGWFEAGPARARSAEAWRRGATRREGSWWEDWAAWSATRAGGRVPPLPVGSRRHPPLDDAPGRYVLG
jgi:polyhydroxyalkanoate synthase